MTASVGSLLTKQYSLQIVLAQVLFYNISITLCKLSILAQLLRFFLDRPFRIACLCLMIFNVAYILGTLLAFVFACRPINYLWDPFISGGGKCIDYTIAWYVMTSLGIVTDIALCVLPMPVLKHLHLTRKQKNGLMVVFALGGL